MEDLIVIEEVYPSIFKNEICLPKNPLKAINSYILSSENKNLIIDTGFNTEVCQTELMSGLEELNIDLTKTELFNTHMHVDHTGLSPVLKEHGVQTIYFSQLDGDMFNNSSRKGHLPQIVREFSELCGLTSDKPFDKGFGRRLDKPLEFIPLSEGNEIVIGEYRFEVVDIPGHTPGHLGLYERKHKLFFCGDHILDEITPNITFWGFEQDILATYLTSLKKIYNYDIDYLFTGHRKIIRDHRQRINELLVHHDKRLKEVLTILKDGPKTASEVASYMTWDIDYKEWNDFPSSQKWFAAGEALSHLEHLLHTGLVGRNNKDGRHLYERL